MALLIFITLFTLPLLAPDNPVLYIAEAEPIKPYEALWNAVIAVESNGDPMAVGDKNLPEWSYGISQIRRVRMEDYNKRSGSNYRLRDAFDPDISKKIFLFYADRIGPYDMEKIAKQWNGSGPKTITYWKLVKSNL